MADGSAPGDLQGGGPVVTADGTGASGLGVLWRPRSAVPVLREIEQGRVGFVEVIAETLHGAVPPGVARVREAGARVVPHGVGLGLGGTGRPPRQRLADLAQAAELCSAPLVSDHVAFVRAGGFEAGHLLPVPRTREMLDVVVANVREATAVLPVPLALEPIATLVEWPGAEMSEAQFLTELLERTDAGLVLDLANLHVNAANRRRAQGAGSVREAGGGPTDSDADPVALLDKLPLERVAYVHVAGGRVREGRWHDTHTDPLWPEAVDLVTELWSRVEPPGLLLERDDGHADGEALGAELDTLVRAMDAGRARRLGPQAGQLPGRGTGREPGPEMELCARDVIQVRSTTPTVPDDAGGVGITGGAGDPGDTPEAVRQRLGEQQEAFLRAAFGVGPVPSGFDPDDVDAVRTVLARKRAKAAAHLVPELGLLPDYPERFVAWARGVPPTVERAADDAVGFFLALPVAERSPCTTAAVARVALGRRGWGPLRLKAYRARNSMVIGLRLGRWQRVFRTRPR